MRFASIIRALGRDESGQDAVEYALLVGFVVCGSAVGMSVLVDALTGLWTAMNTKLSSPG
jgi:Flp pilus assembly pilin Flp